MIVFKKFLAASYAIKMGGGIKFSRLALEDVTSPKTRCIPKLSSVSLCKETTAEGSHSPHGAAFSLKS
jgi:hypothetical protein